MSVRATTWAWSQVIGDDGAKIVLLKLADTANDEGEAWPSRRSIMECCEISEQVAKRRIRFLKDGGWLSVEPRAAASGRQTSNLYRLNLSREGIAGDPLPRIAGDPPEGDAGDPLTTLNPQKELKTSTDVEVGTRNTAFIVHVANVWLTRPQLIQHRRIDNATRSAIAKAVREHGYDDVCSAINAYAEVLASPKHWLDHRWTLRLFMSQRNALPMFLPEADPLTNYLHRDAKQTAAISRSKVTCEFCSLQLAGPRALGEHLKNVHGIYEEAA